MEPLKVKIFYDGGHIPNDRLESMLTGLETRINIWLAENPGIEIVHLRQSESQGPANAWNLTLTLFYR